MTYNSKNAAGHLVSHSCLSENTVLLYQLTDVKDTNEAVTVLFHAFMLEYGFMPKDVLSENIHHCMPKNWIEKGVYKIKYEHKCCPSYTCYMTCVPLYSNVCVHGILCDVNCSESVSLTININHYLKKGTDLSEVHKAFSNIDELSRHFKDNFCLPLLNLLHETIGVNRFYGLRGLLDELKIPLLKLLPVESVVAISAVNKDYNRVTNLPFLWKYLYKRDFLTDGVPDIEEDSIEPSSWKQMYIKGYRKKKEAQRSRPSRVRFPFPQLFNLRPDYDDTGMSIYFDPPPPDIFSQIPPIHPMFPRFFR